jgi:hypothetical protein
MISGQRIRCRKSRSGESHVGLTSTVALSERLGLVVFLFRKGCRLPLGRPFCRGLPGANVGRPNVFRDDIGSQYEAALYEGSAGPPEPVEAGLCLRQRFWKVMKEQFWTYDGIDARIHENSASESKAGSVKNQRLYNHCNRTECRNSLWPQHGR